MKKKKNISRKQCCGGGGGDPPDGNFWIELSLKAINAGIWITNILMGCAIIASSFLVYLASFGIVGTIFLIAFLFYDTFLKGGGG
jgi:hypothetical protein